MEFKSWKRIFDRYLNEMISELSKEYLDHLGLAVVLDDNYVFSGGKSEWLAVYERRTRRIKEGNILIAVNYKRMYSKMCELEVEDDRLNIDAQARITVGHEIGHALVDFIKYNHLSSGRNLAEIAGCNHKKEEDIVEEFGESLFPEVTGVYDCVISDALDELIEQKNI